LQPCWTEFSITSRTVNYEPTKEVVAESDADHENRFNRFTSPFSNWKYQRPLGMQTIFQFEVKKHAPLTSIGTLPLVPDEKGTSLGRIWWRCR
jgi:hypothetical protein